MKYLRIIALIPCCLVVGVGVVIGCALEEIMSVPKYIREYKETQKFMSSPEFYVDFDTYYKNNLRWRDKTELNESRNYKDYIYIVKNNQMVKAPLKINKKTKQLAYIFENEIVCDGADLEQHRLQKV